MDYDWETIEVAGSFFSWGNTPGQKLVGKVLSYDPTGGRNFNDEPCPFLTIELLEKAVSMPKDKDQISYPVGDLISLTCGQMVLAKTIRFADPAKGDVIQIGYIANTKSKPGQTPAKVFDVKIARQSGTPSPTTPVAPAEEPCPF
jgi:hypothetical protein